jgi:Amt family ammonium transporter
LVAITPCAGFVGGLAPIYIGLIAGAVCAFAVSLKFMFGYDDSLDVVGVHLVGGLIGSLLVGVFADAAFNAGVAAAPGGGGLIETGSFDLLLEQLLAVAATMVWSFALTAVLMLGLKKVLPQGIRVSEEDEETGLDLTQHSETGYALDRV